ncbi:endonuclease VII domain-containing protein [Geodermatophilus sp. SYSU D00705]
MDKPDIDFGKNRSLPDGLSFYCKACNRRRNNAWYRQSRRAAGQEVRDHSWVPDGFRWCPACRQAIAHEDFARSGTKPSGFGSQCKACKAAANSQAYFLRRYGMSREDLQEMRAKQADRCALCGARGPEHLDHDHENDFVRALLCQRCNLALGLLRDDPDLMRAAADYVEIHRARWAKAQSAGAGPGTASRPGSPPVGSQRRPGSTRSTGRNSGSRRQSTAGEADG